MIFNDLITPVVKQSLKESFSKAEVLQLAQIQMAHTQAVQHEMTEKSIARLKSYYDDQQQTANTQAVEAYVRWLVKIAFTGEC